MSDMTAEERIADIEAAVKDVVSLLKSRQAGVVGSEHNVRAVLFALALAGWRVEFAPTKEGSEC